MTAIAIDTLSTPSSFQSIDPAQLDEVAGGLDLGRAVNAGNANIATGAKAGGAIGGGVGAVAGAVAGGTVAGAPTMGLGTVGGVLAGGAAGATAGTTVGAAIGGAVGWLGGAASDTWNQINGR